MAAINTGSTGKLVQGQLLQDKYPVKAKVRLKFEGLYKGVKETFLDNLQIKLVEDINEKENIIQSLTINLHNHNDYQLGYFSCSDNPPIILIEKLSNNMILISLFNQSKFIVRDYVELLDYLQDAHWFTKITKNVLNKFPCEVKEYFYAGGLQLKSPDPTKVMGKLAWKYFLLYVGSVGVVNIEKFIELGPKAFISTGTFYLFLFFFLALLVNYTREINKERFYIELTEDD